MGNYIIKHIRNIVKGLSIKLKIKNEMDFDKNIKKILTAISSFRLLLFNDKQFLIPTKIKNIPTKSPCKIKALKILSYKYDKITNITSHKSIIINSFMFIYM